MPVDRKLGQQDLGEAPNVNICGFVCCNGWMHSSPTKDINKKVETSLDMSQEGVVVVQAA